MNRKPHPRTCTQHSDFAGAIFAENFISQNIHPSKITRYNYGLCKTLHFPTLRLGRLHTYVYTQSQTRLQGQAHSGWLANVVRVQHNHTLPAGNICSGHEQGNLLFFGQEDNEIIHIYSFFLTDRVEQINVTGSGKIQQVCIFH